MAECKNCYNALSIDSDFCNCCGGKVIRKRLTFRNLFEHLSETFFNYDNKLLRTFIDLFKKPEAVIDTYVQGVRKRYVNPMSFFGIILTINGFNIFLISKFYKKYLDASSLLGENYQSKSAGQDKIMALSSDFSLEYASLLFSFLIPLAAFISWIVFYNKKYNYTEHVIIYLYSMSIYSIISVVLGQIVLFISPEKYLTFSTWIYVFVLVYHCYILTRLFKLSIGQLTLKLLMFSVLFFASYIGITIVSLIVLFATGTLDLQDFAPKN